ncbi:MAG: hypothetical protein JWM78_686 [Verrucomicrobiaceae bacterium]|nr:hypothetical protein [Verrucomicrobiaceae bacterium]
MTMTLQEISDRMEIQDVMVDYCYAIDHKKWDDLDDVFTPDAVIDYSEMVGFRGNLVETKAFLVSGLAQLSAYQHSISTSHIEITGDTAFGRTLVHNPMQVTLPTGEKHVMFVGLWYRDQFVRTPKGWRIKDRYEEKCYTFNVPAGMMPE